MVISDNDSIRCHSSDRVFFMKDRIEIKLVIVLLIITTLLSWFCNTLLTTLISLVGAFLGISLCSACRRHENLWLFILVGIVTIPANIDISIYSCDYFAYDHGEIPAFKILFLPLLYAGILCLEEIMLGIIGRLIWRNQCPPFDEE